MRKSVVASLAAVLQLFASPGLHGQTAHFSGVESVVPSSALSNPHQMAVDSSGNVYIADDGNNRILKETPTAGGYQESTVASSGLNIPTAVAVDTKGNLYIVDAENKRILKETPTNGSYTQTVLPISGLSLPIDIAVDASGDLYISDYGNANVVKETLVGTTYTQRLVVGVGGPYLDGVAVDGSGNVFVCDSGAQQILKMIPSGNGYSIARIGSLLSQPHGVAVDASGVVYIADSGNKTIVREVPSGSSYNQSLVVSTGSLQSQSLALDSNQNLYFNDPTGGRILKLVQGGENFGTSAVGNPSSPASLIFIFDSGGTIAAPSVVTQGIPGMDFTDAGTGTCTTNGTTHTYNAGDSCTLDVIFTPKFPGARYGAGLMFDSSGSVIATGYVQGTGVGPQVAFPPGTQSTALTSGPANLYGITIDGNGDIYLVDATNNRVLKQTPFAGGYIQSVIITGLNYPEGLALDGAGNIYVSNTFSGHVLKYAPTGSGYSQSIIAPMDAQYPEALTVDGSGNLYIVDNTGNRVLKETFSNGLYTQSTVGTNLYYPTAVAVDSEGNVYIADVNTAINSNIGNGWVIKESPSNGTYLQSTVASGFIVNTGLTVDGNGSVYITDSEGGQGYTGEVYKETPSAGTYLQTTLGSNLRSPWSAGVDGSGNVYVINRFGTGQVLKEDLSDSPVVHFAATVVGHTSSDSPQTVLIQNSGNAAMNVPQPAQGFNPSIPSGFTVNDNVASACPLVDASSPSAGTLAAGTSCNLTIRFSPQLSTDTSGWLTYTYDGPNETNSSYQTSAIPLIAGGAQLPSTLTWAVPSSIVYGTALGGTQLNASANVPGTFSYSPAAGSALTAGSHTLSVSFTPTDTTDFTTATAQVTINVSQAAPSITWTAPSAITYGTALSSTQLNASTPVAGTFSYSPAAGTVVGAGSQTLSATFTPTDTTDYTTATAQVTLTVNQATPTIAWTTPAAITYGTALGVTQLNATASVSGAFSYSYAAGTVLPGGSHGITATFTPTDWTNYKTVTDTVYLTVNLATPAITWATPGAITYGAVLGASQLNASSPVAGSFSYSPAAGTVPVVGQQKLSVTFTPTDTTDYATATATVTLTVNQATPSITWPTPTPISYGTAIGTAQLSATSPVAGTFNYSPAAGTVPGAGPQTLTVTFTPTDTTDYKSASATVTLTVNQATPTINWPAPMAISYGTGLGTAQLNATSPVAGTFAYSPAAGTVLSAGPQTLKVTFTPADTADYTAATAAQTLLVNEASPTITWATPAAITYGAGLSSAQLNATSPVAGAFVYSPASGTLLGAGSQTLTTVFTPTDTADYKTVTATVSLTVTQAAPTIKWTTPAAIISGTVLGATQLDATASVPGTFVYNPAVGATLPVGNDTLSVSFTPTDNVDYSTATAAVTLMVNPPPNPLPFLGNMTPAIADAGGAGFTITVNGSGFLPSSTVYWGTAALTTQFVSSTQLTATVTAANIATAGATAVNVQTPAPGGGTSVVLQFEVDSSSATATAPAVPSAAVTVTAGSTATYSISFPASVTGAAATCLNLPAGAVCSFSFATGVLTISTASTTPTGTYQVTVVFAETVARASSAFVLLPFLLLPLYFLRKKLTSRGIWSVACFGVILLAATAFNVGCGGSSTATTTTTTQSVTSSGVVGMQVK